MMHEESTAQREGHRIICEHLLSALITVIQRIVQVDGATVSDPDTLANPIKDYLDRSLLKHLQLKDIANAFHECELFYDHVHENDGRNANPIQKERKARACRPI
ncbi:hypothetical protein [Paenibacillus sp. MMS18-CY102]|uniref:hypothetical protein n=1 Tax=Paenibacillus sp. MMS18-CY102 TaxID=2682849 RepID=UPI0013665D7B|nr:hypothetical protein [Paenibacillus sp. MMS18-CY102]MWC28853.1 hypothetical protein [Paenibacillus sp. MMS18-CY102]